MDICFYHANCSDGFCAAYVANLKYPGIDLIPMQYGDLPPQVENKDVMVVDFSFPKPILQEMRKQARRFIVLDHHETAKENLEGLDYCIFDMTKSGAMLTWEWCYPGRAIHPLIRYVQDRDLWHWALSDSKAINTYIGKQPKTIEAWNKLYFGWEQNYVNFREKGELILDVEREYIERILKNQRVSHKFESYKTIMVNSPILQSEIGDTILKTTDADIAMIWYMDDNGEHVCSLRSKEVNVAKIAKQLGGGGHPKAAGFKVRSL